MQHLVAADETSLPEVQALLATLPICATGRVFVEVPDAAAIGELAVPPRMTVTWLDRSHRTGAPGSGRPCARGEALGRAVRAWADEMLCGDASTTRVHLFAGYLETADLYDHLIETTSLSAASIAAPARYGIALPAAPGSGQRRRM